MKKAQKLYTALILFFMYMPIFVLILFSFNDGKTTVWKGFTLNWYRDLFKDEMIMGALWNTLIIAIIASCIATVLGTAAAIGINNFKGKKRLILQNVSNIPVLSPDIVTGVSLMLMFTMAGVAFHFQMGFWTVLLAHISFCTPYVVLSVLPRLRRIDYSIYEAALDLGCNQWQAFYKVVIPDLMPGIFTGFLMSLTYSMDDFVITYFTRGSTFQTLPVQIYTMTHQRISPKINALSALMFVAVVILMLIINFKSDDSKKDKPKSKYSVVKYIAVSLAIIIAISSFAVVAKLNSGSGENHVDSVTSDNLLIDKSPGGYINVYNWGEYIADGSEDYLDVIDEFEKTFNIKVNYTTYETNEELYNILSSTNSSYDVVIPSDYMIDKLIKEGLLQKLDYSNIPNYDDIMDRFRGMSFDPDNEYSVPYQWGVVGLVYNKTMLNYKPDSWNDLWNEELSGSILQFNNSRDAYAIAMKLCDLDPSNFTKDDIDTATKKLQQQKPLLKKYVMDQVFAQMENNQAAIAPYYAGDIKTMKGNNSNLVSVLPKEGTNFYVDAMCIPKSAQNKLGAELFINFMTDARIAKANADYIAYATPVQGAYDMLDKETKEDETIYPPSEYLDKCYTFNDVDKEIYAYMQEQFVKLLS